MRITSHHDRCFCFRTGVHSLPRTLVMPAIYHHSIKALARDDLLDLRRIKSAETGDARPLGNISKKAMLIAIEQRNVPLKLHTKTCIALLSCGGLVAVEHLDIQAWIARQPTEPRRVILNRMCTNNRQSLDNHLKLVIR